MNIPEKPSDFMYAYQLANLDTKTFYVFEGDVSAYGRTSAVGAVAAEVARMIKATTKQTGNRIIAVSPAIVKEVEYNV